MVAPTEQTRAIGGKIRDARHAAGLSQYDLASNIGYSREYINIVEGGRFRVIYPEPFNNLCRILGLSPTELVEDMGYELGTEIDRAIHPQVATLFRMVPVDKQADLIPVLRPLLGINRQGA